LKAGTPAAEALVVGPLNHWAFSDWAFNGWAFNGRAFNGRALDRWAILAGAQDARIDRLWPRVKRSARTVVGLLECDQGALGLMAITSDQRATAAIIEIALDRPAIIAGGVPTFAIQPLGFKFGADAGFALPAQAIFGVEATVALQFCDCVGAIGFIGGTAGVLLGGVAICVSAIENGGRINIGRSGVCAR
jgi:hypothetical protein